LHRQLLAGRKTGLPLRIFYLPPRPTWAVGGLWFLLVLLWCWADVRVLQGRFRGIPYGTTALTKPFGEIIRSLLVIAMPSAAISTRTLRGSGSCICSSLMITSYLGPSPGGGRGGP